MAIYTSTKSIVSDIVAVASPGTTTDLGDKLVIDIPEEHDGQTVRCNGVYNAPRNDILC